MSTLDLADGIFIKYTLSDLGGNKRCDSAEWDLTINNLEQAEGFAELCDELGLDDEDATLKSYVNEKLNLD